MDIIYVGSIVEAEKVQNFPAVSVAGNKMQVGILKGLWKCTKRISSVSVIPRAMCRKFDRNALVNRGSQILFENCFPCKNVSYINIILLKQITIFFNILFSLLKINKTTEKPKILIVYNTISYIALPVLIISKLYKIPCVCIIADLPINRVTGFVQRLEDKVEIHLIQKFNALISLTKHTVQDFAPKSPYIIVEAGQDEANLCNENVNCEIFDKEKVNIVYSGTLNMLSGIELVLDVFTELPDSFILHIYGKGEYESLVNQYSEKHPNILYHGTVSNKEIMEIQKNADILVNPRIPDDFTTKYTFPSKILEYMLSGVPVICNNLDGIPNEYSEYINIAQEVSSDCWRNMIIDISCDNKQKYKEKAERAKEFVINNKTWNIQCEKIYVFLKDLL